MSKKHVNNLLLSIALLCVIWRSGYCVSIQVGDVVPGFYLRGLYGEDFFFSKYCGEKAEGKGENRAIVISFFATWCKPCWKEIPQLEKIHRIYADRGVKICLVSVGENMGKVKGFVEDREIDLPIVARAVLVAAGFAFAISLGEFGATIFIARPDYPTLPVVIFRLLGQPGALNFGAAMAASVILMAVTAAAILAIERFRFADIGEF